LEGTGFGTAARVAYRRAVEHAPGAALPLALLAHASEVLDPEAAIDGYSAALAISPTLWLANLRLGALRSRQGAFAEATGPLAAAAAVRPDGGTLLFLGMAAEGSNDIPLAIDTYERLVAVAPDEAVALNQYAWLLVRETDELDRALALATKADALNPGNAAILDTLGWVKFRLGDVNGSLQALRTAYQQLGETVFEPGVALVHNAVAAGDPAKAQAVLAHLDAVAGGLATGEAIDAARALVDG
jgi:tetratricopeptide (TPR) repeat protein